MAIVGVVRVHKSGYVTVVSGGLQQGDTFTIEGRGYALGEGGAFTQPIHPRTTHCVAVHR